MSRLAPLVFFLMLVFAAVFAQPASAHTLRPAVVTMTLHSDGNFELSIRMSAEWLLADIDPQYTDTNDAPNAELYDSLRATKPAEIETLFAEFASGFIEKLRLTFDGNPVALNYVGIQVPEVGDLELVRDSTIQLTGRVPSGAQSVQWVWPDQYASNVLRILRDDSEVELSEWLQQGEVSAVYPITGVVDKSDRLSVVLSYIKVGFEHIVPKGLDHILFVFGIFLLSIHLKPLLWQVTAFTLAHTITLGLSMYGVFSLSPSLVEPMIALSIAYIGIENCLFPRLTPWRVALVFAFGLLHGLGFAGVLSDIGLPDGEYLTALLSFNVGVEFGQLAVILTGFAVLGWWRNKPWYRGRVVIPLSLLIAVTGLYWTWERIYG